MKHLLSLLTMALCLSCTARTAPSKMVSATASAAATPTARHFVITFAEGARLTAYLPAQPSGRAIVDLPGGGYSHLAVDHEGHQWADWMNRQGIAFFVLEYRMPKGDRTIPLTDAYRATGNGIGRSFHKDAIYVRIDNIFCSDHWKPFAAMVENSVDYSDHYPVSAYLKPQ